MDLLSSRGVGQWRRAHNPSVGEPPPPASTRTAAAVTFGHAHVGGGGGGVTGRRYRRQGAWSTRRRSVRVSGQGSSVAKEEVAGSCRLTSMEPTEILTVDQAAEFLHQDGAPTRARWRTPRTPDRSGMEVLAQRHPCLRTGRITERALNFLSRRTAAGADDAPNARIVTPRDNAKVRLQPRSQLCAAAIPLVAASAAARQGS